MATPRAEKRTAPATPLPVRLNELAPSLHRAHKRSGIEKADIVRMAVAAFLEAHPTPQSVIEAAIKYRAACTRAAA